MASNTFYPFYQPPTGFWGSVLRAILGTGRGKFRSSPYNYLPINQRIILIDTAPGSLMNVAMQVPHLNTVISTGAELFSLMEIKHLDKNGEEIPDSPILKFLRSPNPLQSTEQYMYEFYVLNAVYNKTFQHKILGLSFDKIPKAMWLLPSGWMKINATGKIYRQTDINEIIESFEMIGSETVDTFEVEKVIYMAEGIGNNILNPVSRIEALQIPLSNIVASLKSRNIIVSERGAIGFISPDSGSSDSDGHLPPDSKESIRMRKEYQDQYNLDGQGGHVAFSSVPIKWTSITSNIADLGLLEGVEADFGAIVDAFRHDRDMYSSTKGATYENKAAGMKATIQNGLQPLADKLMGQLTKHLLEENSGEILQACYDHLPAMKEDERLAAQGKLYTVQAASQALKDGVISHDQYALICEFENDGTGVVLPSTPAIVPPDQNQKP